MEADHRSSPAAATKAKFSVYQNPSFSAALTAHSLRPSLSALLILSISPFAAALSLLAFSSREKQLAEFLTRMPVSLAAAEYAVKLVEAALGLVLLATLPAFFRALSLYSGRRMPPGAALEKKKVKEEKGAALSDRQLGLLGLKPRVAEKGNEGESAKKPPKSKPALPSEPLVPVRKSSFSYTPSRPLGPSRIGTSHLSPSSEKLALGASPMSPSTPLQKSTSSPSTPWSRKSSGSAKGIQTEAMLEQFLADVDEKIEKMAESAAKTATPPATIRGFGIATPSSVATSTTASGTARSTPLRPVRMSPGSHQKYTTPPKKGEGELPPPMSLEQAVEAFECLGIYPQIEQWRDHLRQWFSSVLMRPLVDKIKTSHIQVKQAAASVGVSITVSQVGSDLPSTTAPMSLSPVSGTKDWQPTVTLDEDGILNQLRGALLRARDGSVAQQSFGSPQQLQQNPLLPAIQACIDAITEHQRLNNLMKGELIRGLLPQSSVRADYTVQRVQELAEGTCLKNYDYIGTGDGFGKAEKKWTTELPTDSHLLLYLFAAFLEHPKWMLHVDPTSYSGAQSSKNPLFLGVLPPKERFPEKYVALISGVPAIIHPGACILAVGKQSPPIFALYWDKKLQFSLQGRTALWDAILLLCHQINVGYGGVVRGIHLGSSALNILPVLNSDIES